VMMMTILTVLRECLRRALSGAASWLLLGHRHHRHLRHRPGA
jgi:hypothetical protein